MKPSITENPYQQPGQRFKSYVVWLLAALLFSVTTFAQGLTLTVTATDESCGGNGSLSFLVQGADPTVPVVYKVFLLPDATNPIEQTNATTVNGLEAGEYLVTATQTVGGNATVASDDATIHDITTPLIIDATGTNATCGADGSISINVTGGTAIQYEITSGPVTRPLQSSSNFNNLPEGIYQVRAVNQCGDGTVATFTLLTNGPQVVVGAYSIASPVLADCNKITIGHSISSINQVPIPYPLQVKITLYPPGGGAPLVYNSTIASGAADTADHGQEIPFYHDTDYYYDIQVTHSCGVILKEHNLFRAAINAQPGYDDAKCGNQLLTITPDVYMPPYTIAFQQYPPGFNPNIMNTGHPGPFVDEKVEYGDEDNPAPFGQYKFTLTDACGHTASAEIILTPPPPPDPLLSTSNSDCVNQLGKMQIEIPLYVLATAVLTSAPANYTGTLPQVLTGMIDEEKIKLTGMPPGTYVFDLTDECGHSFTETAVIPNFGTSSLSTNNRPDCSTGKGSARVSSFNPPLVAMSITAAPADFQHALPYNVTNRIAADGSMYMDNLPPGTYTFKGDDSCSTNLTVNAVLSGYSVTENDMEIIPHCGSFDLTFNHTGTGTAFLGYWLQKEVSPGVWGHPETDVVYPEGTAPTTTNSAAVTEGVTNYSIEWVGHFRILKRFQSFGDGISKTVKECIEVLQEFDYSGNLEIVKIKNLSCPGTASSIEVITNGVPPITYRITHKNTLPFAVDNGTSGIFNGLQPAVYTFQIEDSCGRQRSQSFNVASLPPLVVANTAPALEACDKGNDGTEVFDLSSQDSTILGNQDPDDYTLTYHTTLNDAQNGLLPLPDSYNSGNATIFARVAYDDGTNSCQAITSFQLKLYSTPVIQMNDTYAFCEGKNITITAPAGFGAYEWSSGTTTQLTRAITVNQAGQYTLTVLNNNGCEASKTITVVESPIPYITNITVSDWTQSDNVINVAAGPDTGQQYLEYSIDGLNYQPEPVFTNLEPGQYTVYVRDIYRCGYDDGDVFLLTYPRFFTPNGDGTNERWRIKFSHAEPDLKVYIFDRYGKLITSFGSSYEGWDGTYNGARLPATDYWFVVKRQDGREMKGHFSMLR